MTDTSLSDLTPVFFLQTFILELMHASEQSGQEQAQQLIEHIARTAGCYFEEIYRADSNKENTLDRESYIELILGLKNNIGGKFSLSSSTQDSIKVCNSRCPFGEKVVNFPSLCGMTSSVFGGIAARNFGYAKVEIAKSIANHDGCCEVYIHLNQETAKHKAGVVYRDNLNEHKNQQDIAKLHSKIEQSMLKIWRKQSKNPTRKQKPPVIIANSEGMKQVLQSIEVIAPTSATLLIQGQTGVGKELIARAIHAMSHRCSKPFVAINCGAIPENLIESVLFGHEKGAFTGAIEVHRGYFERADGGTLFLDEVDSLSAAAQTRLLRVLQENELERVGGKQTIPVDTRIISATNTGLQDKVSQGLFREDLYYRINVVNLEIPPLRERPEDIPALVHHIVQQMSQKHNKPVTSVSREVMQKIKAYHWPGNVRELENTLERSVLFAHGEEITDLKLDIDTSALPLPLELKKLKQQSITEIEVRFLQDALKYYRGDIKKMADFLEISTRAVYQQLKKYQLNAEDYRH
ncbi:sigma 54-interacting transcriptional regulator [methane-oxidizing endosymbiont of Gigantopelta aegis]|uniref:sigma 54-interacting transcriptional regulator n=1 Tax=methane-oxidizing endosymbiont of Gigantopelta aegis TaxID=2794938 RepID=UPI0018DD02AD|nr:sigma 54-interacting transcriptional regulator [methane-oxidizing endosymbiont of Gigantopelta aegis]